MKRKALIALSSITFMVVSVGAVFAYFSLVKRTPLGQFQTASTDIIVTANSVDTQDLLPGDQHMFVYSVQNVGTVPVSLKSKLDPVWSDPLLDPAMVKGVELTVHKGSGTQTILASSFELAQEVYFSDEGNDLNLWELSPGEEWHVEVTVTLDESAGEEYMLANYSVDAVVGVKELGDQVPWPVL